jgi:hypothetical protein
MPKSIVDNVLATLSKALRQLQAEVEHLARQIARVDQFISSSRRRVRKGPRKPSKASRRGGKRRISAAGRARIGAAQRKRWGQGEGRQEGGGTCEGRERAEGRDGPKDEVSEEGGCGGEIGGGPGGGEPPRPAVTPRTRPRVHGELPIMQPWAVRTGPDNGPATGFDGDQLCGGRLQHWLAPAYFPRVTRERDAGCSIP